MSLPSVLQRRPRARPSGDGLGAWWLLAAVLPLTFLAVFFLWPVGAMFLRGVTADGALDLTAFGEVLGRGRTWQILGHTLGMAAALSLIHI